MRGIRGEIDGVCGRSRLNQFKEACWVEGMCLGKLNLAPPLVSRERNGQSQTKFLLLGKCIREM